MVAPGSAPTPRHTAGPLAARPSVLLVDDDPAVLESLGRLLHRAGFRVLQAGGTGAALALLWRERVDIIVSDLRMPGVDGLDFLERARAVAPRARRILLTGHLSAEAAVRAINRGEVFRCLAKPVDQVELLAALREAVAPAGASRAAPGARALLTEEERAALRRACQGMSPGRGG